APFAVTVVSLSIMNVHVSAPPPLTVSESGATADTVPVAFIVFADAPCALAKDGTAAIARATAKTPTRRLIPDLLEHSTVPTRRCCFVADACQQNCRLLWLRTRLTSTET